MIWQSNSEKETFAVAEEIARQASPGDIYLLEGDLGASPARCDILSCPYNFWN